MLAAAAPPVIRRLRETAAPKTGALQGAPISPLLSNIYLHPFDLTVIEKGYRLVRYCDDFVILCRTETEAHDALGFAGTLFKRASYNFIRKKPDWLRPAKNSTFSAITSIRMGASFLLLRFLKLSPTRS